MRLPDPIANTTTEAYLAYKAGVLNVGDLKPSLYDPYLHYDAWLAYWAGLVNTYPVSNVGKNLYNKATATATGYYHQNISNEMPVEPGLTYTFNVTEDRNYATAYLYDSNGTRTRTIGNAATTHAVSFRAASNEIKVVLEFYAELNVDVSTYDFTGVQFELGSTATAYEPYTSTPEILTDEEALVAYLSGVTNTYPEEYSDPIDARITGYLRYLVSAKFGRPDYPVNNIEFYLSLMKPPIVTNDTPSSNIELDDTVEAAFVDVKMYGDTSQTTYTGKNLYRVENRSQNGVTFTVNADGSLNIVGKATADVTIVNEVKPITLMADNSPYICWWDGADSLPAGMAIRLGIDKNGNWDHNLMSGMQGSTKSRTFTSSLGDGDAIRCELYVGNGTEVNLQNIKIQLEAGSTATSFEPYVGGVPAPNPDYPQEVEVVTGRQVVASMGKNLFNKDTALAGRRLDGSGTIIVDNNYAASDWVKIAPSTTYAYSRGSAGGGSSAICYYDKNKTFISRTMPIIAASSSSGTVTSPATAAYARIDDFKSLIDNMQLEKGSTATTFEPYKAQEYEVNLGKNLWDKDSAVLAGTWQATGSTYTDGVLRATSTGTSGVSYAALGWYTFQVGHTYTISFKSSGNYSQLRLLTPDNQYPSAGTGSGVTTTHTLVYTPAATETLKLAFYVTVGAGKVCSFYDVQIEEGSTATTYIPYFDPIELCKIGDYQDYFYKSEDKWYVHKAVGKYKFTSSETGSYQSQFPRFSINFSHGQDSTSAVVAKALCTHLKVGQTSNTNNTFGISANVIYIHNESCTSLTELNQWFADNDVIVYYALATPTDTEITNAALAAQLDALAAAKSYNGKTYITVEATDPNLPALLKVEAGEYR